MPPVQCDRSSKAEGSSRARGAHSCPVPQLKGAEKFSSIFNKESKETNLPPWLKAQAPEASLKAEECPCGELGPALCAVTAAREMKGNRASAGDSSPRMHGLEALSWRFLLSLVLPGL